MNLYSKKTNKLTKNQINDICKLKDTHWKHGLKSQKKFFSDFTGINDIHNFITIKKKIIGYTLLRKAKIKFLKNQKNYLHFDTLIILKKYREQNISKKLMKLNNKIIKKEKTFSILLCEGPMIKFYKNYNWHLINKKLIITKNLKKNYMLFNRKIKKKFSFVKIS